MRSALFAMFLPLLASAAVPAAPPADLILRDGRFYPVSSPGAVEGSLAIAGGRILFLGATEAAEAYRGPSTEVIELRGRAVTPGWIDAHSQLLGLGAALSQVDLVGTTSYEEVVQRVAAAAAEVPPGSWIRGHGWDQNDWAVQEFPRHQALTAAVPDHPVWLARIDGHAALLNARAMEQLGVGPASVDPPGGRIVRDEENRPTGVLVDRARDIGSAIPDPGAAELGRRLRLAAAYCLERGLTGVTDMGLNGEQIQAYRDALAAGELPLRAALFLDGTDSSLLESRFAEGPWRDPSGRLSIRGVKLYADGALGSRGAALLEPYADDPDNLGLLVTPGDELRSVTAASFRAGFQVGIHAIGDRGSLLALDAMESAFGGEPHPEARFRLEHAQVMRPADIERMGRLGVVASVQPTHATSDMPWAEKRIGARRILGAYAWRRMIDAGARLALGSDFPVERVDPLLGLYAAVTRQDLEGDPPGGWMPDQRLTREEALAGFTLDAAWSLFLDDEVGSLEPGKRADLVVFDADPMTVDAPRIPSIHVDLTLVDGAVAYSREVR
ncbi:MAG: amidohydrolase [Thermoanaerobaculia bacterium]